MLLHIPAPESRLPVQHIAGSSPAFAYRSPLLNVSASSHMHRTAPQTSSICLGADLLVPTSSSLKGAWLSTTQAVAMELVLTRISTRCYRLAVVAVTVRVSFIYNLHNMSLSTNRVDLFRKHARITGHGNSVVRSRYIGQVARLHAPSPKENIWNLAFMNRYQRLG